MSKIELSNVEELCYRHIHPDFYKNGKLSASRFKPSQKDQGFLSVDRSSLVTAEQSFNLYASSGKSVCAVFAVSLGEFNLNSVKVYEDPTTATATHPANAAHCLADFNEPKLDSNVVSMALRDLAVKRGVQFPAPLSATSVVLAPPDSTGSNAS